MKVTPMKILMVHADKVKRGQLAIMLARFDHGVVFVNGMALSELNFDDYDLIIVDEHLHEVSGIVLLQQLSEKIRCKTIYFSSGDEKERVFHQNSLNIYECMGKPVKPMDLAVVACDFFISSYSSDERFAPLSC
jgi:DNA-binding response OmpR family regulator